MECSESEQLVKILTAAHQHALHRQYQAAAQALSKAAALLPMDTDVHLCLAGMLLEAGNNLDAEQASTLAVATSADTAKAGLGYALRANIRWCQGNLLGAHEDLQVAQQAMQASESRYATNMSEDLEWLASQISACSENLENSYHTQEDNALANLEAIGKVAQAKPQEVAQLGMQVTKADTQVDQDCKSGCEDALNQLVDDGLASTDPNQVHVQPEQPPETGPLQNAPLALDSTVQGKGCAAHKSSVALRDPPNSDAAGPVDPGEHSLESNSISSLGHADSAGSLAGTSPQQADAVIGMSDLPLHDADPTAGVMAIPQAPVLASPVDRHNPYNVLEDYATDLSRTVSSTAADVSCRSNNGRTAGIVASTSQQDSDQALEALQPFKEKGGAHSDAESDQAASEDVQVGGTSSCEDTPQDCSLTHIMESPPPDDVNFGGSLHGIKALVKGHRTAVGPCLWRNTAIGVSLAIACAAALVLCQMNAKTSQH